MLEILIQIVFLLFLLITTGALGVSFYLFLKEKKLEQNLMKNITEYILASKQKEELEAKLSEEKQKVVSVENPKEKKEAKKTNLEELNVKELKELARAKKIKGYYDMKRETLIELLKEDK